ncbi:phosphatidylinositol 4-kinase gamma 4-like [Cucurbita maxima]|uniref:1-phosphatidylinositol 4-kinase n=1 Tax=Cucurbita maxima TaxID=3661 RepID=A0A6J1KRV5_CUCMA|nr:phosphatidylinositol 4-kinase gamma 4-like [Cucurbita maxima]
MSSMGVIALCPVQNDHFFSPNRLIAPSILESDESIWIYVSVSGSMSPMPIFASESIESVKLRIQSCKGFVVKKQKLVCGGRELSRNRSLVRDYGVTDGNVLHLVLRLSDLQVINVKTYCGKEFTFHVERDRDIAYVKEKIGKKVKEFVDTDEHEVVCGGRPLDDHSLVADICNRKDAVIHLFVRKSAKVRGRPVDKNFELSIVASNFKEQCKSEFSRGSDQKKKYNEDTKVYTTNYEYDKKIAPRRPSPNGGSFMEPIVVNPKIKIPIPIWDMLNSTIDGLDHGHFPVRSLEGTGGAYLMLDSSGKKYVSVFKPIDEEPMAVNNPRGLPLSLDGEGLKKGTRVGEGAFREVAAYILDHPVSGHRSMFGDNNGFAGVPPTVFVKCFHDGFSQSHRSGKSIKIGSLQMFMENNGSCEDFGAGAFPTKEVHKISVLDIRLANADRHAGNILLGKEREGGRTVLIPIDHGYCLPTSFEDCTFEWLYWPQAQQPYDAETLNYIQSLDAEEDIGLLKFHGWELPLECARTLRISTMLLKKGAKRGLTPFEIGNIMCRENLTKKSVIEECVEEAMDSLLPGTSEATFLETVYEIIDDRLDLIAASLS